MTLTRDQFIDALETAFYEAHFDTTRALVGIHTNDKSMMDSFLTTYLRIQIKINYYVSLWDAATSDSERDAIVASIVTTIGNEIVVPSSAVLWPDAGGRFGDIKGPDSSVLNNLASYATTTGKLIKDSGVPSISTKTQSSVIRSLDNVYQISSSRDSYVNYSIDIATNLTLTTGQSGTVFLEIASDSGFTTNVQELCRFTNGQTGTLTIGLSLNQNMTTVLSGYIPSAYYVRLRTLNNVGTPSYTYKSGQEIIL